ncbi:hypothetical protein [uncultured Shewanella sp.]|uniref:hypothetical protein n=1 Tax=uncultured Shewanella sp. TaxID=173975 RepID=UPI00261A2897|nr:hypothetical protein [uncultured Shewanella sp.]
MKKFKILLCISFVLTALSIYINWYVNKELSQRSYTGTYQNCHKIWASRGLYENRKEQNSIVSFQRAFSLGAIGGEVDFYYDVKLDDFIVSHDRPKKDKNGVNIYQKKLTLNELLIATSKNHYFWFDYKNLDRLSADETKRAITRLKNITAQGDLRNRIYLEGSNPLKLSQYTNAGFNTILAVGLLPSDNIFSGFVAKVYKVVYYFSNVTALAIQYGKFDNPKYSSEAINSLSNIPRFIFHVPVDEALINSLIKDSNVRVVLVGRDLSVNKYNMNVCI